MLTVSVYSEEIYRQSPFSHHSGRSSIEKRATRVLRLPPLVPPSFHGDDFSLRQVYTIPRAGKSIESSLAAADDDDYSLLSESESGAARNLEERQAFSKIPRVGKRSIASAGNS